MGVLVRKNISVEISSAELLHSGLRRCYPRPVPADSNAHAIDCHNHFGSPRLHQGADAKEGKHNAGFTTWFALQNWKNYSPAKVVEDMDKQGTQTCMLSATTPGAWFGIPKRQGHGP